MNIKLTLFIFIITINLTKADVVPTDSTKIQNSKPLRAHEFAIKLGLDIPVGAFGNATEFRYADSFEDNVTSAMNGSRDGFGAKTGCSFDLSSYFCFKKKKYFSKFGLKVTWLNYSYNSFKWDGSLYIFDKASYERIKFISFKVGPAIRLVSKKGNLIRLYCQLCPTRSWHGGWGYKESAANQLDYANFYLNKGNGLKNEIGLEFSAGKFTMSYAYNFGKIKYKSINFYRTASVYFPYYNVSTIGYANEYFEATGSTNTINLSVGMMF